MRIRPALLLLLGAVIASAQSTTPNTWTLGTPMPTTRQGPFSGAIGSEIYVIGGLTSSSVTGVNEIYNTATNTWSSGAPMPTPRWIGASAVVNNILYAMGGTGNGGMVSIVESYNPTTNTWSTETPMPFAANSLKAVALNNMIYVVGGYNSANGRLATMLSYNPATKVWSTLAPLKVGKSESAVAVFGSTIISAGGLANSGSTVTDTEGYNATSNAWTALTSIPTARQAGCFGVVGGLFYVAAGAVIGGQAGTTVNVTEAYDPVANAWTGGLPAMPNGVAAPGSATVNGRLYCFGGSSTSVANSGALYNYVQIYQAPLTPSITPGGVITASAFGASPSVAPGSWIEIYGSNLAGTTRPWAGSDFNGVNAPTTLSGTTITIGGVQAFIDYISPSQIDAQVPNINPGPQQMTVTTTEGTSASYPISVNAAEPGLLAPSSFIVGGKQYLVALFTDFVTYVLPPGAITGVTSQRAKQGDTLVIYGIGFGAVTPNIPAGQIVGQSNMLAAPMQFSFGGVPANPSYAGLAPGYVGLYQFNVTVPNVAASDLVPVTFTLGGVSGTQTFYLAVGN